MEASNYEILKVDEASKADTNILSDKKISSTEIYKTGKNVETFGAKSYDDLRAQHEAEMALFDLQLENAGKNKDAEKILIKARKDNLEVENQQPAVQKELTTINTLLPQTETSIQDTLVSSLTEIGKIPEDKLKEIATKLGVSATSLAGLVETCKDCTIATFDLDAVKAVGKVQFFAKEQYLKDVAEAYKNGVQYSIDRSAGTATFMTIRKILTELSKLSTTTTPSSVTNLPTSSDNNLPTSSVTNPLESSDKIQVADIKALPEDTQRKLAEELTGEADKVKSTDADLSKNKIILQNFVDYNTTKKRIDEMITENATLKASGAKAQEINDNKKVIASDKKDNAAILTQLAKDTKTDKPTLLKNFNETMAKYYEALQTKIVEVSKTTPATTIDNITTTIPPQTSNTIPLQTSNIIIPQTSNSTLKTSNSTSNTPSKAPTLSNTKKLDIKSDKVFTAINDSKIIDNYPNWKDATEDKRTEAKGIYSELKPLATDTDIIATLKKYDDLTTLKITSELFAKKIRMTKADKVEKASLQKVAQNIITRESEIITAAKAKVSTTPATVDNTTTNATPDNTSTNTTTNIDNTTSNSTPNTSNNTSNTTPDNTTPDNTTTTVDNTTTTVDNTINRATETIPIINIKEDATTTDQNTTANDTNTTDNSETKKVETGDASFTLELLKAGLPVTKIDKNLTYETIFNKISKIKNDEVRQEIEKDLLIGDILSMQKYAGMKAGSLYSDNIATGKLDYRTLGRITNQLFGLSKDKLLACTLISQDVRTEYKKFEENELNQGLPYAIISKQDFNLYLFTKDHKLISIHKTLLGADVGDQENKAYLGGDPGYWTTPGGMYHTSKRIFDTADYAGPGEYIGLYPEEKQYDINNTYNYTMGIHNYYKNDPNRILMLNDKTESLGRRVSNGCINTLSQGAIFDNLTHYSKVYVCHES